MALHQAPIQSDGSIYDQIWPESQVRLIIQKVGGLGNEAKAITIPFKKAQYQFPQTFTK
jgi:hypothetical protein